MRDRSCLRSLSLFSSISLSHPSQSSKLSSRTCPPSSRSTPCSSRAWPRASPPGLRSPSSATSSSLWCGFSRAFSPLHLLSPLVFSFVRLLHAVSLSLLFVCSLYPNQPSLSPLACFCLILLRCEFIYSLHSSLSRSPSPHLPFQTDMFKVYVEYVNNFDSGLNLLAQLRKENAEFAKFLAVRVSLPLVLRSPCPLQ